MSTGPLYQSIDRLSTAPLPDMVAARAGFIPRTQHALMTGYGGPPQARSIYIAATSGTAVTRTISVRATPGITSMDLELLASGLGTITLTTSTDTTGIVFQSASALNADATLESAQWLRTSGPGDTTLTIPRQLLVRASPSWGHEWVNVTIVVDPFGGQNMTLFSAVFHPVHIPR